MKKSGNIGLIIKKKTLIKRYSLLLLLMHTHTNSDDLAGAGQETTFTIADSSVNDVVRRHRFYTLAELPRDLLIVDADVLEKPIWNDC